MMKPKGPQIETMCECDCDDGLHSPFKRFIIAWGFIAAAIAAAMTAIAIGDAR